MIKLNGHDVYVRKLEYTVYASLPLFSDYKKMAFLLVPEIQIGTHDFLKVVENVFKNSVYNEIIVEDQSFKSDGLQEQWLDYFEEMKENIPPTNWFHDARHPKRLNFAVLLEEEGGTFDEKAVLTIKSNTQVNENIRLWNVELVVDTTEPVTFDVYVAL